MEWENCRRKLLAGQEAVSLETVEGISCDDVSVDEGVVNVTGIILPRLPFERPTASDVSVCVTVE